MDRLYALGFRLGHLGVDGPLGLLGPACWSWGGGEARDLPRLSVSLTLTGDHCFVGARCEANTFDGERCLYGALSDPIRRALRDYKQVTASCRRRDYYDDFLQR